MRKRDIAFARVVDIARHRQRFIGWSDGAGDEALAARIFGHDLSAGLFGNLDGGGINFAHQVTHLIILHSDGRAVECVRLNDIGACFEVGTVDI